MEFKIDIEKLKIKVTEYFKQLQFQATTHQYKVQDKTLNSVSSVIKRYTEPFNAYKIAFLVARARTKAEGKEYTREDILKEWDDKKNAACDRGNIAHEFGENYMIDFNNRYSYAPRTGFEEAIIKFWKSLPEHIVPFLFELKMFSEKLGIAGTADIILYNTLTNKFIICDYKTNEDLFKNYKGKTMLPPFEYLLDSPYSKYELQLSMYQVLLQQCGIEVESRNIIWLKEDGTYERYQTQDLTYEIEHELEV